MTTQGRLFSSCAYTMIYRVQNSKHVNIYSTYIYYQVYCRSGKTMLLGVITPNHIPLTTIVTYLQKCYRSRIGPLYLHAVWYLPFTNSPRKYTITYHFSDLQEVYSGNRQIHTKCQLQYLHPPHISTSGKCHCVIIHQTPKATEYIG